jgi:hypothetical protein
LTHIQAVGLLGAYLDHVASVPYDRKGSLPMANTLNHHLQSAISFIARCAPAVSVYSSAAGGPPKLHPSLLARLELRRKWQKPREKREPFTIAMLQTLGTRVSAHAAVDARHYLALHALVFDAIRLGIFTGSRVGEYAQSKGPRDAISRVPDTHSNPAERGKPIAFVAGDFVFYDRLRREVSQVAAYTSPSIVTELHLTFRHDKSGRGFTVRKFGRGNNHSLPWLCPVDAALSLLRRASALGIPPNDPICAYRPITTRSSHHFLRDSDVTSVMRGACLDTYPDPTHYMHRNVHRVVSHSNRVTAAVALRRHGADIPTIAFRLRWKPESVDHYLRECTQDIDDMSSATIAGALRN